MTKPKRAFMQPMAEKRNKRMNRVKRMVREVDHQVRERRSAKSMEAKPVSKRAAE